jgi:putative PIN family toxin of toxin-antitoxin system
VHALAGDHDAPPRTLVLDTNIVLDLFVFDDPQSRPLRSRLLAGEVVWLATRAMREELERVLAYAHIEVRLSARPVAAAEVLAAFDRHARLVDVPEPAVVNCADRDDKMFVDLAVRHRCMLLSKDLSVLTLKRRLAALQVDVGTVLAA